MAHVCCAIRGGKGHVEVDCGGHGGDKTTCGDVKENEGPDKGSTSGNDMASQSPPLPATTPRWAHRSTPFSLPRTDEGIVMQSLYAVLTPLLSGVEKEWHKFFRSHFDLEYENRKSSSMHALEDCVREVLLEWGYSDTSEGVAGLSQGEGAPRSDTPPEFEEDAGGSTMSQEAKARSEISPKRLSGHGASLLAATLNLYSFLGVHSCCCLMAPPAAGKTTVWRVSAEDLEWNMKLWLC